MMPLHDRSRKTLFAAGAALLALAVAVPWAVLRLTPRGEDDPQGLLRRALEPDKADPPRLVTSKTSPAVAQTSSGEAIRASVTTVETRTGKTVGYAPRLQRPLKPGETATLKLPGGGHLVISGVPAGAAPPPTSTPTGNQP